MNEAGGYQRGWLEDKLAHDPKFAEEHAARFANQGGPATVEIIPIDSEQGEPFKPAGKVTKSGWLPEIAWFLFIGVCVILGACWIVASISAIFIK